MKKKLCFVLICLLTAWGTLAHALRSDANKPTNIEADEMTSDDVAQVTTFSGNVIITKGSILIKSARAIVKQDPEGYQYITLFAAPGSLASFRQKQDDGPDTWTEAYGEIIEYDNKTDLAKFRSKGHFMRIEGKTVTEDVKGEYISYNAATEYYSVHNTKEGVSRAGAGRIKIVMQPKSNQLKTKQKTKK